MDAALRQRIVNRAGDHCEYCQLPQSAVDITFHVEHIVAKQHGGGDEDDNLALACDRCNHLKGPNLSSIDRATKAVVLLFHPRRDAWDQHFTFHGADIEGRTSTGRATAQLLQMNSPRRRALRAVLRATGEM
ncbi:MAG: HNH endonuclease [Planctomycetaceae bacterium]